MTRRLRLVCSRRFIAAAAVALCCCRLEGCSSAQYEFVDVGNLKAGGLPGSMLSQAPLGPEDRVVVRDGHFFTVGNASTTGSGKRVRFFGVSLALSANFPSAFDGDALAKRLATLGVNIVRLHAIDQPASGTSDGPVGVLSDATRPELDPQAVQSLSRLISALTRHGIYVDLNLFANHTFTPFQPGDHVPSQSQPLPIFDIRMQNWQEIYAKALLEALHLRDNPGLALVEVNNESTLIDAWQDGSLPERITGRFREMLQKEWDAYRTSHELNAAKLPLSRTGLSEEEARHAALFFLGLDERYIDRMIGAARSVLGNDVPISGTQIVHAGRWNHGGFVNFDINRAASFTDAHFYIDHYFFPHRQWDWKDWRISNSWLGDALKPTLLNTAFARAANRPFVVGEFNQPWPNEQSSDLLPTVTQFAVSQDWDALILYDYAHDRDWSSVTPSDFSLRGDLTKLVQFAQCAAYFRHVLPDTSSGLSTVSLTAQNRISAATDGINGNLAAWLEEHFGVSPALAMHARIAMKDGLAFGVDNSPASPGSSYFAYDRKTRQFTFGSAYAAGISGYLPGDHEVDSSVLGVSLAPGNRGFATAFLTSLDDKPLSASTHLLLTLPGATMGTGPEGPQRLVSTGLQNGWQTIRSATGDAASANLYRVRGPVQMERISATITLRIDAKQIAVSALDMQGKSLSPVKVQFDGRRAIFDVNGAGQPFAASYEIAVQR